MRAAERSLHWAVQKWLSPTTETPARVTQCRAPSSTERGIRPTGALADRRRGRQAIIPTVGHKLEHFDECHRLSV